MRTLPDIEGEKDVTDIMSRWTLEDTLQSQCLGWGVYVPDKKTGESEWLTYPIGRLKLREVQTAGKGFHALLMTSIATKLSRGEEIEPVEMKLYLNNIKSRVSR